MNKSIVLMLTIILCGCFSTTTREPFEPNDSESNPDWALRVESGTQFANHILANQPSDRSICRLGYDSNPWQVSFDLQTDWLFPYSSDPNSFGEIIRCHRRSIVYWRENGIFRIGIGWTHEDGTLLIDKEESIEVRRNGWHHFEFLKTYDDNNFYVEMRDNESLVARHEIRWVFEPNRESNIVISRFNGVIDNLKIIRSDDSPSILFFDFNEAGDNGFEGSYSSDMSALLMPNSNHFTWILR